MKKQLKIITLAGLTLLCSPLAFSADADTEFADFKNQQTQGVQAIKNEFEQYKKELEEGFSAYKKAYKEAYEAEKRDIKNIWGDYRPGDKKRWVQYEKGGVRKSVNFESGEVELEVVVDKKTSNKAAEKALKQQILTLLSISQREAFNNDRIAQAVEKKMAQKPQVKTAIVADTLIMSSLVPGIKNRNPKKIQQISNKFSERAKTDIRPAKIKNKKIIRVKFKIPTNAPKKSKQFLSKAQKIANKEKLPLTLVMAIMETESAFNPMARSHVPAYGLMQIVPRSAGQDATAYLFGKAKILSPSYLYNSDKNIEIGGAYLHILYYNYLKKINDPVSRLYCAIAAYNTGAGNVAKTFTGKRNINKASRVINKMSPKEVYNKLRKHLPYEETQRYVKKVSTRMPKYNQI